MILADYVVLKRRRIQSPALFDPHGPYRYLNGVNVAAFAAVAAGVGRLLRAPAGVAEGRLGCRGRCGRLRRASPCRSGARRLAPTGFAPPPSARARPRRCSAPRRTRAPAPRGSPRRSRGRACAARRSRRCGAVLHVALQVEVEPVVGLRAGCEHDRVDALDRLGCSRVEVEDAHRVAFDCARPRIQPVGEALAEQPRVQVRHVEGRQRGGKQRVPAADELDLAARCPGAPRRRLQPRGCRRRRVRRLSGRRGAPPAALPSRQDVLLLDAGQLSTSGLTLEKPVRLATAPVATTTPSGPSSRTNAGVASVSSRTSTPSAPAAARGR